jgi:sterol desaturase/sphingolipid hydroxylase (fatty acid hydroxylase superfamily)
MSLLASLLIVLALSGVLMFVAAAAYRTPTLAKCRLKDDPNRKVSGKRLYVRVFANMTFSTALVFAIAYGAYDWLFTEADVPLWRTGVQLVAILLVYDFLYYLMHRFAFHQWAWLKKVHAVHHTVRHPNAVDSLYLHPLETFLGLFLLMVCTAALGPVTPGAFGVVFGAYSFLNILVHCGLDIPMTGLRTIGFLARKHDLHHTSMRGGNFASITPIWDRLFGTAE